jgi:hypothetical protein
MYLLVSIALGYLVIDLAVVKRGLLRMEEGLLSGRTPIPSWVVLTSGSVLFGILLQTSIIFLLTYLFVDRKQPLLGANIIGLGFSSLLFACYLFIRFHQRDRSDATRPIFRRLLGFLRGNWFELTLFAAFMLVWLFFLVRSVHFQDGVLSIGASVNSDFGPHTAMVRSFSMGHNFPPQYPHYPDGTMRYHFLFQFLIANLEFLGMRMDWAFNLPSIIAFTGFAMLLYALAVQVSGSRAVAVLTLVFFLLRSSFAVFGFLDEQGSIGKAITTVLTIDKHIGKTSGEDWGLWAQKSLINQRHMPFAMGISLFAVVLMLPLLKKTFAFPSAGSGMPGLQTRMRWFLWSAGAWLPQSWARAVVAGVALGLCSYWNGAVILAFLSILAVIGIFSRHRLEFAIVALIAGACITGYTHLFMGTASPLAAHYDFGFIAKDRTLPGLLHYYVEVLGVVPFLMIAVALFLPGVHKVLLAAFLIPAIIASTLRLTPDLMVNYKFVVMTVYLANILFAIFLVRLFRADFGALAPRAPRWGTVLLSFVNKAAIIITIFFMVITGIIDLKSLYNIDTTQFRSQLLSPAIRWVRDNTPGRAVFLTDIATYHPVLLAGRPIFYGWPYFAWSAGYDVGARETIAKRIYAAADSAETMALLKTSKISYVVIDNAVRHSGRYQPNENFFRRNFPLAYRTAEDNMDIYRINN